MPGRDQTVQRRLADRHGSTRNRQDDGYENEH